MLNELIAAYPSWQRTLYTYRGGLRSLRPIALDQKSSQDFAALKESSEAVRRLPSEHGRILAEMRRETEAKLRQSTGRARFEAGGIRKSTKEAERAVADTRRDASLSFPQAFDHVSRSDLIQLASLEIQTTAFVSKLDPAKLFERYERSVTRTADPAAFVFAKCIEELSASGAPLASAEADLPTVKALRALIHDVQDLRLPSNLPDFAGLITELDRLDRRAELVHLVSDNSEESARVFADLRLMMAAAGAKDDAEDQAELRAELVS